MPPLKFFSCSTLVIGSICLASLFSNDLKAVEFEVTPLVGHNFSPDLTNSDNSNTLSTTNEPNLGLALSWKDSPKGQGQLLVNYISRDFNSETSQSTLSFDTIYTHFSGISFFKERYYITTFGIGIGTTYFNSDFDSAIYPSFTAAIGTRYEFSDNLAFITELRTYATLTDDDDTLFCESDTCHAQFDGAIWIDGQFSIGLSYSF